MRCQIPCCLPGRVVWCSFVATGLLPLQHLDSIRLDNADMKSCIPGSSLHMFSHKWLLCSHTLR